MFAAFVVEITTMFKRVHDSLLRYVGLMNWVLLAVGFCLALLAGRIHMSGYTSFFFLSWNLALAMVPLLFSSAALALSGLGARLFALLALVPWLIFLPNAPYILTDILHLRARTPIPIWYDMVMLLAFALTGLLLGYLSLMQAERVLLRYFKRPVVIFINGLVFLLCGFGIYLGRFLRWNSWEIVTRPRSFFDVVSDRFLDPTSHPQTWAVTATVGVLLAITYALVRGVGSSARAKVI